MSATILAAGSCLPPAVHNDAWSPEVVAKWPRGLPPSALVPDTAGGHATLAAWAATAGDPFQGVLSRPRMPDGTTTADMEIAAARRALASARIDPERIDFILQCSTGNASVVPHNGFEVHAALGLNRHVLMTAVDSENDSFLSQVAIARALIESGRYRCGLLLQSSQRSHLVDRASPSAAVLGDGATAVLVGAGAPLAGVLAEAHFTDSSARDAYRVGAANGRWWDEGPIRLLPGPPARMARHFLGKVDLLREACDTALARAGLTAGDIGHYACHQASSWFLQASQETLGLTRATSVPTFREHGSLSACNIPRALELAIERGLLAGGEHYLLASGGAGETWSVCVGRWGVGD